jgi:AhpD family alkylhydroperoxidase
MTAREEILAEIEEAFSFIPGWLSGMPDEVLEQYWTNHVWLCNDTGLSGRDKALIAYGVAAAIHCGYRSAFHAAQLALFGLDDDQIKEAAWVAQTVAGASAYLHGIRYSQETFEQELDRLAEYRRSLH